MSQRLPTAAPSPAARIWAPLRLSRQRPLLWGYRLFLVFVSAWLLHGVVANVLLLGGVLARITQKTGVVQLDSGMSFSLWPGLVHLRHLHLEVIDSNVHLQIEVPSGRAKITLLDLLHRRFSTSSVQGNDFVLRLRPRFKELPESRQAALPPLEDSKEGQGGSVPGELWGINIQGVEAEFDELWVSEVRYRGSARVSGGFHLQPLVRLSIAPSAVELSAGAISYGPEQRVLDVQQMALSAELLETEVDALGERWQENLAFDAALAAKVVDVRFVEALSPSLRGLSGGAGELAIRGAARGGKWVAAVNVDYATQELAYSRGEWRITGPLTIAAQAAPAEESLGLDVTLGETRVRHGERHFVALERAQASAVITRQLAPHTQSVALTLEGLALESAQVLKEFDALPARFRPEGGRVSARAKARWHDGGVTGSASADLFAIRFAYADWAVQQHGRLDLEDVAWPAEGLVRSPHASLELRNLRLTHPDAKVDSWNLRIDCQDLSFEPRRSKLRAGFVAASDDAKPALVLLGVTDLPPALEKFLSMPTLRIRGSLELGPERQEVRVERAESKTIDVKGRFVRLEHENHAAILFKARPFSVGVEVRPVDGGITLLAGDTWLNEQLAQLEADTRRGVPPRERHRASP